VVWDEGTGPTYRHDGAGDGASDGASKVRQHDGVEPAAGDASGRPPWQVRVGVVTYAIWWTFVSIRLVQQGSYSAGALAGAALWTAVTALVLYRVWRRGPVARWLLHQFGVGVGAVLILGIALLTWTLSERLAWDLSTISGPLVAVVLFGAGLLFGTAPARAWCPGPNPGTRP
jgi:hypothetical protein